MVSLRANGISASGLRGAGERRGHAGLRPAQRDRLAAADQFDLQLADRALHRAVDPAGQPAGEDVERGLVASPDTTAELIGSCGA